MIHGSGALAEPTRAIRSALGGRRLIWFGIRGEDGEALAGLPELAGSCSIVAPLGGDGAGPGARYDVDVCLERLRGARPDLDRYDVDLDPGEAAREFGRRMLAAVGKRCVVMTYRPSALVSALAFSMADTMTLAGPLNDRQTAFEHKPWVERSLAARGVRGIGWRYVADEHRGEAKRMLARGPHVLRASHASGGVGIVLARTEEDVDRLWPAQQDAFVAVAPFLDGVPINLSGCVFDDGSVRLHPPSVQLIGIGSCTDRAFGYCGNDFGGLYDRFGDAVLARVDALGRTVGRWLHEERYRGAFGVDAIVSGDEAIFTEVNARFQGSSALSSTIARELDVPDLFLDHLAAMLGLAPLSAGLSIEAWARRQPALSRIVVHNTADVPCARAQDAPPPALPADAAVAQLAHDLPVDPGGTLCCVTLRRSVTATGFALDPDAELLVDALRAPFAAPVDEPVLREHVLQHGHPHR